MLLDSIETIRQVLSNAIEQGLPGAQTAMKELEVINSAMVALKSLEGLINQAAISEANEKIGLYTPHG